MIHPRVNIKPDYLKISSVWIGTSSTMVIA